MDNCTCTDSVTVSIADSTIMKHRILTQVFLGGQVSYIPAEFTGTWQNPPRTITKTVELALWLRLSHKYKTTEHSLLTDVEPFTNFSQHENIFRHE